jgi:hypothetical protein
MRHSILTLLLALLCLCFSSCDDRSGGSKDGEGAASADDTPLQYPYEAEPARRSLILENWSKIEEGMTSAELHELMGSPDEIQPLYEPVIKNPRRIGTTCFYVVARPEPNAPLGDCKEVLVRMNMDELVTEVVLIGIDEMDVPSQGE